MFSSNPSRRHHYVPQFYLRQWCDSSGRIWVYRREPTGRVSETTLPTKSVGFEWDLYAVGNPVPWLTPWATDDIEKGFFAPLDERAAKAHRDLLGDAPGEMSESDQRDWAQFLYSLVLRSPAKVRSLDDRAKAEFEALVERMVAGQEDVASADRLKTVLSEMDPDGMARNAAREALVHELRESPTLDSLMAMKWTVFRVCTQDGLLASDAPVVIHQEPESGHFLMLAVALSPERLFVAHDASAKFSDGDYATVATVHNLMQMKQNCCKYVMWNARLVDRDGSKLRTLVEEVLSSSSDPRPSRA